MSIEVVVSLSVSCGSKASRWRLQASLACQEDWQRASSVVGSVALVASSKPYNTVMEECVCEESVCVCQTIPLPQSLSAPQPEFETDQRTWSNCLLLHQLLIIGDEEQVLTSVLLILWFIDHHILTELKLKPKHSCWQQNKGAEQEGGARPRPALTNM